jgi:hypothetical protein
MKLTFSKIRMVLVMLFSVSSAFADGNPEQSLRPVRLIEIKAEYYPNETYYLGYYEKADHSFDGFFFEGNDHQYINYSTSEIMKGVSIIQTTYKDKVYDLVRAKLIAEQFLENYTIKLSYLHNGLTNSRYFIEMRLVYNPSRNQYELQNEKGLVSRAYVTTNYWGKIPVGIDQINTQK